MSISQDAVRDARVRAKQRPDAGIILTAVADNPWRTAAAMLSRKVREYFGAIILASLICAALLGAGKLVLPAKYKAITQILIDPQTESRSAQAGGETQNAFLDANAAINSVESQMGVIMSERVLLRVVRDQGLGAPPAAGGDEDAAARRGRELAENRALLALQKAVTVSRAERSFLVTIAVSDPDTAKAAAIANAIVKAYGEVNAIDRAAAARRTATDLGGRVDDLQTALSAAQDKLQSYRERNNLVGLNDRTIVERRVNEATDSLAAAERIEAQARARLKQLEASPNDLAAVAAFGADPESRQLQILIAGRAATAAEVEQLQSTLGDRHPALVAARARLKDYGLRISASLDGLRRSARAQIAEAQSQVAASRKRLAAAAEDMGKIKQADPTLRQLEDAVEAKRKALTELELKQRLSDGGRVEGGGFRVVSPARAPIGDGKTVAAALWSLLGGIIGVALAIGVLAIRTVFDGEPTISSAALTENAAAAAPARAANAPVAAAEAHRPIASLPVIAPRPGFRALNVAEALSEVWRRPDSPYALAVAQIYGHLRRFGAQAQPMSVLVAATAPQCGASTLAANLARVAAAQGKKVLLIDANRAHPTLGLMIEADAPKTLIKLANLWRPLARLQPYGQSLSLIPSLADEDRICREIAEESDYERIDGIAGNFDLVVFDGPDLSRRSQFEALVSAASAILLVAPDDAGQILDPAAALGRASAPLEKFAGFVGSRLIDLEAAA